MFSPEEIAELEKKYSKYIFKKIFKNILFLFLILIIMLSSSYYFFVYSKLDVKIHKKIFKKTTETKIEKKNIEKINPKMNVTIKKATKPIDLDISAKKKENNISKNTSVIAQNVNTTKHISAITNTKEKNNTIVKKISNEHKIKNLLIFHVESPENMFYDNTPHESLKLNILSINKEKNIKKANKKVDKNDTIEKKEISKPKIKIEMQDIDSIRYLKSKYEKTHDINFALMLCEEFYSQKDYIASLKWSIIANDIDNQSEKSWIWFAKSKFRLGKKDDAIRALKAFLRTNTSNTAELLLKNIQNGSLND